MEEGLESDNGLDVSLCSAVLLSSSHSANTPHLTHRHHPCHVSVSLRSRFGPLVHVIRIRTCRERGSPSATYRGFHTLASQHPRNPKFNGRLLRCFHTDRTIHVPPLPLPSALLRHSHTGINIHPSIAFFPFTIHTPHFNLPHRLLPAPSLPHLPSRFPNPPSLPLRGPSAFRSDAPVRSGPSPIYRASPSRSDPYGNQKGEGGKRANYSCSETSTTTPGGRRRRRFQGPSFASFDDGTAFSG